MDGRVGGVDRNNDWGCIDDIAVLITHHLISESVIKNKRILFFGSWYEEMREWIPGGQCPYGRDNVLVSATENGILFS
jgi:hypothetical protein